jgi:drug/metabolite transporter (DMT)-like permease
MAGHAGRHPDALAMSDATARRRRALLQIHVCVLLWAFTAILGRLITLPALELVAWRLLLVVAVVGLLPPVWRAVRRVPPRRALVYLGIGGVVALHWFAFYGAIKASNASVATICLAVAPVTIALLEPILQGGRPRRGDLLLGLAVVPGIVMIAGGLPAGMWAGVGLGVAAAVLVALYMSLNKRWAADHDPLAVTALEFAGGLLVALVALLVAGEAGVVLRWPAERDLVLLVVLAIACTVVPFALSLLALRQVTAFTAQLAVNLEPIYAMGLAAWLLGEARELDAAFYGGAAIVIIAVLAHGVASSRVRPAGG